MRITDRMASERLLQDILEAGRRRLEVHRQMSSGKRLERPSDDPAGVFSALGFRSLLRETARFRENNDDARGWLEAAEASLSQATDLLHRARELAVEGASDTVPPEARKALAQEVRQLREELISIGNATYGGRYMFGGRKTTQAPYDAGGNYSGESGPGASLVREIGPGVYLEVTLPGIEIFGDAGSGVGPLKTLEDLASALDADDQAGINSALGALDADTDNLLQKRTTLGAKLERVEMNARKLLDTEILFRDLLSRLEDADLAEVAVRFATEDAAYRQALAAAAQILRSTLLDFLR